MTKLKNTKKGMAKKALSISLVAAMLATSNVPVWAAEDLFSDGSAAVEAPAVEEPVEAITDTETFAAGDVITENDIDVSGIAFKVGSTDVKGKEVTYGDTVAVTGQIVKKTDNTALQGFEYGWRIQGETAAIKTGEVSNSNLNENLTQNDYANYVGKTLEFYVFRDDNAAKINPTVVGTVKIVDAEIKDATLELDTSSLSDGVIYNGHDYVYGEESKYADASQNVNTISITEMSFGSAGTWNKEFVLENFTITTTQSAKNAGEKLIITATPKASSPYKNSVSAEVEIKGRAWAEGDIVADLNESLSYQYTGNQIDVPTDKITLKEKPDTFANATFSSDLITSAKTVAGTVGNHDVDVVFDGTKIKNWDNLIEESSVTTSNVNKVEIKKRDLSSASTTISIQYGKIPVGATPELLCAGRMGFKGTEAGTPELNLVSGKDYVLEVKKSDGTVVGATEQMQSGTYTATITAPSTSTNTFGTQTFTFVVGNSVVKDVAFTNTSYKPAYTGSAIEPTKDDLGNLIISESLVGGGSKTTTIQKSHYEIVSYAKNTDAATYDKDGKVLTQSDVVVKILPGAGSFENETFTVHFEIQPLTVSDETVTVPKTISYNSKYTKAEEYNVPLIVTAKDSTGKIVKGLSANDFTVKYEFINGTTTNTEPQNEIHDKIKATLTITNPNFKGAQGKVTSIVLTDTTEIVAKALTDSMIQINPSSYTYTGGNIIPEFVVLDGSLVLYDEAEFGDKGEYKVTGITGLNVGTGKVTIEGVNDFYSGTASATFQITPANTSSVKVEISDQDYTGRQVRPRDFKATLNGNDVTKQFEIVSYGENVKAGKGTVVLRPVDGNKNFTGSDITAEFNIVKEKVEGTLAVYDENGKNVTTDYELSVSEETATTSQNIDNASFIFDGTAKTFGTEKLTLATGTKAEASDFEIKYADNISGKKSPLKDTAGNTYNIAYAYAVAKEGTGYAGTKTITLADGSKITGVVDYVAFVIKNVHFNDQNVTVKNGAYAGGLPVKPQVLVQIKGNTLVEGKDYELKLEGATTNNHYTDATTKDIFYVTVIGKGGYEGSTSTKLAWGIDKKDLADCDVKAVNGVVTVMNGYIPVPTTEYTVKENDDETYTVTANKDSKNYTGSKTVVAEGQKPEEGPEAPVISEVKVSGNKATVVLSGESDGATGYDYVISKDRDCINNKNYDKVNKNILGTETTFTYTQQGVYYAYCHAWKRVDGVKVFSDWSAAYPFVVSAITPEQPSITKVEKSSNGKHLRITWTKSANAIGYDVVMGTKLQKVNGEYRPVEYGKAVKKVTNGNTVSVIFYNIPKGTYYVGLHAYNRSSESGVKVFSQWSNSKKVTF